jgi:hypothetical protein
MKARGIIVGCMLLLASVACLEWWRLAQNRRAGEATIADLQMTARSLAAELKRETARAATVERESAGGNGVRGGKSGGPGVAAVSVVRIPTSQAEIVAGDPKLQVLELKRLRAAYRSDYRDFFLIEGLTAGQIDQFVENCVKASERNMDLRAAADVQDAAGKKTVAELQRKAKEDYESAQRALLGDERYARLIDHHERAVPVRNIVIAGIGGAASLAGVPLTGEQSDRLLAAALASARDESGANPNDLVTKIDWDALDAKARDILTPAQFELFTKTAPYSGFTNRFEVKAREAVRRAYEADVAAGIIVPTRAK